DEICLNNIMDQINGKGPTGILLPSPELPGVLPACILKFKVNRNVANDPSRLAAHFRDVPPIAPSEIANTRTFIFDNQQGAWTINNRFFDFNRVDATVKQGTAERWILKNASLDWQHPIHIHLEEHQIVSRDDSVPPNFEQGRKDVTVLLP